jgi:hypothetical protein
MILDIILFESSGKVKRKVLRPKSRKFDLAPPKLLEENLNIANFMELSPS